MVFQQRDKQDSQNLNTDNFYRPTVTSGQCIIGIEKHPDAAMLLNYDDGGYSQEYCEIKESFRAVTKNSILNACKSYKHFRSTNVNAAGEATKANGYNIYTFDIRYRKNLEAAQSIKREFKLSEDISAGRFAFAIFSMTKLGSVSSDGQRLFGLILALYSNHKIPMRS